MDWLRRNWPDLIIGVALVAVVALIVVTLLSGGSLASLVRRGKPPELAMTNTTSPPNTPSQTPVSNTSGTPDPATGTNASEGTNGAVGTGADSTGVDSTGADSTGVDAADGKIDVFVPSVPGGRPDAAPDVQAGLAQPGAADKAATSQAGTGLGGGAQDSAATPADTGPLPDAAPDGGFRVAAGAVDSRDAAVGLAESYREAGYAVTVEQQNDLYLLWIGPYATRDGAERVASRLITDNVVSDALVYTYSGPDAASEDNAANTDSATAPGNNASTTLSGNETASVGSASGTDSSRANVGASPTAAASNLSENNLPGNNGANTGANPSTDASAGNSGAPAGVTPPTNPATATGQRYLQVGAFASDESAQPLREQLGALGFNVTQSVSDSGLVRLLVGPFGAAQLTQAQERLAAQGVSDAFPVIP